MRTFLLETSAVVRWAQGKVPVPVKRQLVKPANALMVSICTPWEIAIKPALQKFGLSHAQVCRLILEEMQAEILPLKLEHLSLVRELPYFPNHNEAFDRIYVAQAIAEKAVLVGSDGRFPQYEPYGLKLLWD